MIKRVIKAIHTKCMTLFCLRKSKKHGSQIHVNHYCVFTKRTDLGSDCHFNGMHISGNGNVTIGNHFHSGNQIKIITSFHNYDAGTGLPYDHTYIDKDVTIGDNVWLGSNVIILGGVTIGEGAVIQAGSCVVSDIPKCAVAGGHPAKVFKMRNIEHYETLREKQLANEAR